MNNTNIELQLSKDFIRDHENIYTNTDYRDTLPDEVIETYLSDPKLDVSMDALGDFLTENEFSTHVYYIEDLQFWIEKNSDALLKVMKAIDPEIEEIPEASDLIDTLPVFYDETYMYYRDKYEEKLIEDLAYHTDHVYMVLPIAIPEYELDHIPSYFETEERAKLLKQIAVKRFPQLGSLKDDVWIELAANGPEYYHEATVLEFFWSDDFYIWWKDPIQKLSFDVVSIVLHDTWNGSGHEVSVHLDEPIVVNAALPHVAQIHTDLPKDDLVFVYNDEGRNGSMSWDRICGLVEGYYYENAPMHLDK